MADNMFEAPSVNLGGKQKYTVLLSIVVHTFVITAAIVVPLVATDTIVLPARFTMMVFQTRPPLPPSLPQPAGAPRPQMSIATPAIPIVAPAGIILETPIKSLGVPDIEYNTGMVPGIDYTAPPAPPPAPAAAQVPMRPGGDIKRPLKVRDMAPAYPSIARSARVEGIVIVEATIGPDGKVQNARILRSVPLLDAAALDAVRQWEYTPTLLNGMPIAIVMTVTVDFRLR